MAKLTAKEKHRRDVYLKWKYNHSLEEINVKLKAQKYGCAICGKKKNLKGELLTLHVDHWHWMSNLKVISFKVGDLWHARVYQIAWIVERNKKRGKAIKQAKRILLRLSVRGLLCWRCNTAIQKFRDDPVTMIAAGKYIQRYLSHGVNEGISLGR